MRRHLSLWLTKWQTPKLPASVLREFLPGCIPKSMSAIRLPDPAGTVCHRFRWHLGKGLGQSMNKLGFIPEAQNDMIFSIICEELGFFRSHCHYSDVCDVNLETYGHCQQCTGFVRRSFSGRRDGSYGNSGYLKHSRCYGNHSQYRYFPAVYQLRRYRGVVPACGNRHCFECCKENTVKGRLEPFPRT